MKKKVYVIYYKYYEDLWIYCISRKKRIINKKLKELQKLDMEDYEKNKKYYSQPPVIKYEILELDLNKLYKGVYLD